MAPEITAVHERVDDIPVILALLLKMRMAELIDKHYIAGEHRTKVREMHELLQQIRQPGRSRK